MPSISFLNESTPAGDFEKKTVSTTVVTCTAAKLTINQAGGDRKRAIKAYVSVETNSIRVRFDGTDPDASTGHLFASGDSFVVAGEMDLQNLKMIRASADATVQITYFYNR